MPILKHLRYEEEATQERCDFLVKAGLYYYETETGKYRPTELMLEWARRHHEEQKSK